jgi:hypothetical protein
MQTSASPSLANRPPFAGISSEVGKPDSPVQRGSAHERLRACVGDWRASGKLDAGEEMRANPAYRKRWPRLTACARLKATLQVRHSFNSPRTRWTYALLLFDV